MDFKKRSSDTTKTSQTKLTKPTVPPGPPEGGSLGGGNNKKHKTKNKL